MKTPIFLLVDVSRYSFREGNEVLSRKVKTFFDVLQSEGLACDNCYVSVISFSDSCVENLPLTPISFDCEFPRLTLRTSYKANLANALEKTRQIVLSITEHRTPEAPSWYKPMIFIFSDCYSDFEFHENIPFNKLFKPMPIVVPLSANYNMENTQKITSAVITVDKNDAALYRDIWKDLFSSISIPASVIELYKFK